MRHLLAISLEVSMTDAIGNTHSVGVRERLGEVALVQVWDHDCLDQSLGSVLAKSGYTENRVAFLQGAHSPPNFPRSKK